MRLLSTPGKRVGALASDGRRVVACEVQGYTHVSSRRTGELYRLHVSEPTVDARIDGEVLYLVGGHTGTVRAVGLVDGETRPCPSLTGADALRIWEAPDGSGRGIVAACFDGLLRTFDAERRPVATFGLTETRSAFDVRGTTAVVAYEGLPLRAYDCRTGAQLHTASDVPSDRVLSLLLDDAGLVTAGYEGTLCAYDATLRCLRTSQLTDPLSGPISGPVAGLSADPRDAGVLHAMGPGAALRLDRGTLGLLERVPVESPYDALAVDSLGRLVGVDGGVEMLDPLPPPPPADPDVPDLEVRYDRDAFFDKDLPGMCATAVEVWQDGRRITLCSWYHEEGSRRGDMTVRRGTLERVEGTLVHLAMDDGSEERFDLTSRRLV